VENLSTLGRGESNLETRICSSQNIQKSRLMSSFFLSSVDYSSNISAIICKFDPHNT
jgi:hypothetical protein